MNMLVITTVFRVQILIFGCHIIDLATGIFTMPRDHPVLNLSMHLNNADLKNLQLTAPN